ncbi:hypothetical protein MYCTH_2301832 [Thermothelomyces thermophilus ATCC 42464]|uniref:Cyanovirin-N domain-containing protein n=1 Tax=Thermothelomyces thermophilus (strain ATCC 42464 / BCRC 31852 / DSM 1799) TaxID=573729 RepID=G2QAC1_THET4|nr:uncharacterized protein MYCTH_2301832 [Thermothelomyces thermophilus ATCC 42464]AEO56671.1 hypothetical protein MYCTH_2301832 [Thermothelomyces thermophilus ATCC 42464]
MKPTLFALVLGLGASGALAANFADSCDAKSIKVSGKTLRANCKNIFGQSTCSKLNLNKCIKNVNGRLQADPSGAGPHFDDQCVKCTNSNPGNGLIIGEQPSIIYCKCNPGPGAAQADWPTAIFDLSASASMNSTIFCEE